MREEKTNPRYSYIKQSIHALPGKVKENVHIAGRLLVSTALLAMYMAILFIDFAVPKGAVVYGSSKEDTTA